MNHTVASEHLFDELAYREGNGIEVSLLWQHADDSLSVFVVDTTADETFELAVGSANALDVFNHPYAYAARAA